MRKRVIFIFVLVVCLFVSGCTQKEEKEQKNQQSSNQQHRITEEEFLEYYGIAEEEMKGIDINSFVNTYDIKLDDTDVTDIRLALQLYKEHFGDMGLMSYGYMLEEPVNAEFTSDKVDDIIRIAWKENRDESIEAVVFDFENERIYDGTDMEEFDKNELVGSTDEVMKQEVIQLISDYDLYDWKDYYQGGSMEGSTGWYNWQLAIEFSDGTIYRTGGNGSGKEAYPENMYDFIAALRECEPQNNTP